MASHDETFNNVVAQCYNENVKLKRQSQMLLDIFETSNISPQVLNKITEDEVDGSNELERLFRRNQGKCAENRIIKSPVRIWHES